MKSKFKFFRGYIGTLDIMDGETYATASLYNPNGIRVDVNANPLSNNEMERWYAERERRDEEMRNQGIMSQEQYNLNRDMFAQQEIVRRRRIDTDNQIRLFQTTTTVTVNPTPWTKVKIFGTRVKLVLIETWKLEPIGVVVVTLLVSVVTFIGVMKLFGA
jgi:hypothetical protein